MIRNMLVIEGEVKWHNQRWQGDTRDGYFVDGEALEYALENFENKYVRIQIEEIMPPKE